MMSETIEQRKAAQRRWYEWGRVDAEYGMGKTRNQGVRVDLDDAYQSGYEEGLARLRLSRGIGEPTWDGSSA